jgi:hypothetical protein
VTPLNTLARKAFDGATTYDQVVHFVQVYIVEPHPEGDPSPYSGEVWEAEYSGGHPQVTTCPERVAYAREVKPELQGSQTMLVDDLTPGDMNNPAWCTYGPCPNCAFLIGQDGILAKVQTWFNDSDMEAAIDDLLR